MLGHIYVCISYCFWHIQEPEGSQTGNIKTFKRCFAVINILINIVYFWTLVSRRILGGWSQSTKMLCFKPFLPHTLYWSQHLFFLARIETRLCCSTDVSEVSLKPDAFSSNNTIQRQTVWNTLCICFIMYLHNNEVMLQRYFFFFFFLTQV